MKYRLEAQHYLWDQLLEAGTEIGDDTPYPIPDGFAPSGAMVPLDDEARKLRDETAKNKVNFGRIPEEDIPIRGDQHPFLGVSTVNRNNQPIIPPPLEHLTRPSDMRPSEGMSGRTNPLVEEALVKQNERMRKEAEARQAEEDKRLARESGAAADKKLADSQVRGGPAKPSTGPTPGMKPATAPASGAPKPPAPPSTQVPRNTSGLVPESDTGEFKKPDDQKPEDQK